MTMRRVLSFLVVLPMLLAAGCREVAFPPAGSYSEVTVFADGDRTGEWAGLLVPILTKERDYYVGTESPFHVTVVSADQIMEPQTVKTIVLCGVLDGSTAVGGRILELLGPVGAERVKRGEANFFKKEGIPLPGQLTLIITAADAESLRRVFKERGEEIPDIIEASARERLRKSLYAHRRAALSEQLRRHWGFYLDIPSLYALYSESDNPPGVELHRDGPPRVLGVFWKEWDHAPSLYKVDELFDMRADYVRVRYDGDQMDRDRVRYAYARLGPYTAVKMSGYWYNDRYEAAGGFYETYFVWDKTQKLLWAVDLLVFAPGHEKTTLVRELEAVAETFRYD